MIKLVIFSWVAAIFVTAEMQLYPTNTDDLQSIVQSVKEDVDRHVKLMSNMEMANVAETSDEESTVSPKSSAESNAVMIDDDNDDDTSFDEHSEEVSEYLSDASEAYYGSVKGRPGVDFPDYTDIPKTSFTCLDKTMHPPAFYADMDTGCQVFHVCWPDRRESFLCPMGTIFNQAISACDYWYNSNCSLAYLFYDTSSEFSPDSSKAANVAMTVPVHKTDSFKSNNPATDVIFFVSELMPVKAKIVFYPKTETQRPKIVVTASTDKTKKSKSRKESRHSKHSRVPRSLDYTSSSTKSRNELESKITIYHLWEAMNNAVEAIRNNETTSHLAPNADRILNFLKKLFRMNKTPTMVPVEPGSELEKYDIATRQSSKKLVPVLKKLLEAAAWFMHDDRRKQSKKLNREVLQKGKFSTLKYKPLTKLNPRFIVKPATEMFKERGEESRFVKSRIKRDTSNSEPTEINT